MQTVVELALESPLELRMIEIPGMKLEEICMHRNRGIFEVDDYFHGFALRAGGEIEKRMLVELKLRQDAFKPWVCLVGHISILTGVAVMR
jgi:hypothetical protein